MAMIKRVAGKIQVFNKESVKEESKMCTKCGSVMGLEESECKKCNCPHSKSPKK